MGAHYHSCGRTRTHHRVLPLHSGLIVLIVAGTVLAALTWVLCICVCTFVGFSIASLTSVGQLSWADARRGMWWGLLILTTCAYAINLALPLSSTGAALIVMTVVIVGAGFSALVIKQRGWKAKLRWSPGTVVVTVVSAVACLYLAVAVLGPVTNYDSGLYHLGSIHYAAQYPTIPGLANLYFPFGYANAEFPMAALLESTPWANEGFRLLNGLIITMVLADLVVRWAQRPRGAGGYVLLVSVTALLVPMVALSDYWVTSPSQDSAVFAVTLAAAAMIVDACSGSRGWVANGATAVAMSVALVLMRPTMIAFVATVILVLIALRWRRGATHSPRWWASAVTVGVITALTGLAGAARDFVLSGWLLYPLSILPFDVPWRAEDPVNERLATLGFHRDPSTLWDAAISWGWIGPWFTRLPHQWEFWLLLAAASACAVTLFFAMMCGRSLRGHALLMSMAPSLVMTLVWWTLTPPSFRFAWGPTVTCLSIPTGWALWRLASSHLSTGRLWRTMAIACFAVPVILVVVFSGAVRLDVVTKSEQVSWKLGFSIPYAVVEPRQQSTRADDLASGLVIRVPTNGEQCWSAYPLCSPQAPPTLRSRGTTLMEGFLP